MSAEDYEQIRTWVRGSNEPLTLHPETYWAYQQEYARRKGLPIPEKPAPLPAHVREVFDQAFRSLI